MAITLLCAVPLAAQPPTDRAREAIMAALTDSAAGWNAGDLKRFMAVYADAPTTTFVTATGLAHGKAEIASGYRDAFSDAHKAERGMLSLDPLDFRLLDPTHALLIARFRLAPAGKRAKPLSGITSLVFWKSGTAWKIIADHSS